MSEQLTVEEIKECIEEFKPDGFDYLPSKYSKLDDQIRIEGFDYAQRYDFFNKTWTNFIYPLFLQKVIEGINRVYVENESSRYCIHQEDESIDIYDLDDRSITEIIYYESYDSKGIDQAKTQAIKYILNAISEVKA